MTWKHWLTLAVIIFAGMVIGAKKPAWVSKASFGLVSA
jgi:hypothetical protein